MFKTTTAGILSAFTSTIDKLKTHSEDQRRKAAIIGDKIDALQAQRNAARDEADAANAAAVKLTEAIGGAA